MNIGHMMILIYIAGISLGGLAEYIIDRIKERIRDGRQRDVGHGGRGGGGI